MDLCLQEIEVINDARGNQRPEQHEEFSLLQQVGFARLPNHVGDVAHGLMHRQRAAPSVFVKAEQRADHAEASPRYKRAWPPKPPPGNVTWVKSGRLMSASPAKALVAQNSAANIAMRKDDLVTSHKVGAACRSRTFAGQHFLPKICQKLYCQGRDLSAGGHGIALAAGRHIFHAQRDV